MNTAKSKTIKSSSYHYAYCSDCFSQPHDADFVQLQFFLFGADIAQIAAKLAFRSQK